MGSEKRVVDVSIEVEEVILIVKGFEVGFFEKEKKKKIMVKSSITSGLC